MEEIIVAVSGEVNVQYCQHEEESWQKIPELGELICEFLWDVMDKMGDAADATKYKKDQRFLRGSRPSISLYNGELYELVVDLQTKPTNIEKVDYKEFEDRMYVATWRRENGF